MTCRRRRLWWIPVPTTVGHMTTSSDAGLADRPEPESERDPKFNGYRCREVCTYEVESGANRVPSFRYREHKEL
ncbi:hypothetical protein ZHAS_00015643 [Anopheles sinensis]|uniref:Uncharacterized protein n=1 Tax=Anopheles sinensis TaxID=74873 RepID=A0A084WB02_ANOSI|nr:hypothetical protein ZHAS_00015643 [Anopheles sinensis]